jgi:hypothetical protein
MPWIDRVSHHVEQGIDQRARGGCVDRERPPADDSESTVSSSRAGQLVGGARQPCGGDLERDKAHVHEPS